MNKEKADMIIYTTEDGLTKVETTFDGDTVWLSIDQMAELFQRDKSTISRHIKNIFTEGELQRNSVVANFATTATDGKTYQVEYYNLDVIISVGYRVKSKRGTQFRIWATEILKEYMRKGFALDDDRLKNLGGSGYFKELLDRIRDIRASEKVFYRQVLEIYATSIDYDPKAEISIIRGQMEIQKESQSSSQRKQERILPESTRQNRIRAAMRMLWRREKEKWKQALCRRSNRWMQTFPRTMSSPSELQPGGIQWPRLYLLS